MMMFLSNVSVLAPEFQTYRSTRFPSTGTSAMSLLTMPDLLCVQYRYTPCVLLKFGCSAIPSSPRSDALLTGRLSTVLALPLTTRWTVPAAFWSTKKSFDPRNAMLVGWSRPETTVLTDRLESSIIAPCGGGSDAGFTVSVPNSPCASSSMPAVKNSVLDVVDATPSPNWSPHSPSILMAFPAASRTLPRSLPESKSNASTAPSPKLPTNSALLNSPKPSNGAQAIPHGAFRAPRLA